MKDSYNDIVWCLNPILQLTDSLVKPAANPIASHGGFVDLTANDHCQPVVLPLLIGQTFNGEQRTADSLTVAVDEAQTAVAMKPMLPTYHITSL